MTIRSRRTPSKYPILNGVMTYPDGREVCQDTTEGRREYRRRTIDLYERQKMLCAICGLYMIGPTMDHECSRAAGRRDDRVTKPDGTWRNAAVHIRCNTDKGSVRYHWQDGLYVPRKAAEQPKGTPCAS